MLVADYISSLDRRNIVCNKHDTTELTEVILNVPTIRTYDQHQSFGPLITCVRSCSEPVSGGQCP